MGDTKVEQKWEGGEGEDLLWKLLEEKERDFKEEQRKEEEEEEYLEEERERKEKEHNKQLLSTLLRISSMSICSLLDQIIEEEEAQEGEESGEEQKDKNLVEGRTAARKKRRRKSVRGAGERKKTPRKDRPVKETSNKENEEGQQDVNVGQHVEVKKKSKKGEGRKRTKERKEKGTEEKEDKVVEKEKEVQDNVEQQTQLLLEVISTEQTYCASLKELLDHFSEPMKSMISSEAHRRVFANVEAIQNLSHNFLAFIEAGRKEKGTDLYELVVDAFRQFSPFFKIYSEYCSNHTYANHSVRQCLSMVPKFKEHCESMLQKGHQPLASYLILPIQRVPRFKLFLLGLRKATSLRNPMYERLEETISKIDVIGDAIEEYMERIDQDYSSWLKIEEIHSRFSDADLWFHKFEEESQIPNFLNEENFVSLPEVPRDTHNLDDYFDLAPTSPRSPRQMDSSADMPPLHRRMSVYSPKAQFLDDRARSPDPIRRGSMMRSPELIRRGSMRSPEPMRRGSMRSPEPRRRGSVKSPDPMRRGSMRSPEPIRRGSVVPPMSLARKKGAFALDQELGPDFKVFMDSDPLVVYLFSNVLIFGKYEEKVLHSDHSSTPSFNFKNFFGKKTGEGGMGGEGGGDLEYEAMLPLETTFVLRDGVHENVLHVVNPTRSFALLGGNADIVKRWMEEIQTHIDALVESKPSLRARRERITFSRGAPRSLFVAEEKVSPAYVANQISMDDVARIAKETTAWETANLDAVIAASPDVKKHHSLYMQRKVENSPGGSPSHKNISKSPRRRKLSLISSK